METSIEEIPAITQYRYLGGGYFEPYISLEDYILKVLSEGHMTRGEMSRKTGIPRTTLYDTLEKLLLQGTVKRYKKGKGRGRRRVYFILRNHALRYKANSLYNFY